MRVSLLALVLVLASASVAAAQPTLIAGLGGPNDYGTQCLSPNDDGSSNSIPLATAFPSGLNFFGTVHTAAFVNTNGNITFGGAVPTYTPLSFPLTRSPPTPMIAPYWADVDIRGTSCSGVGGGLWPSCMLAPGAVNGVYWNLSPGRMVVTWDRVGYFGCNDDLQMTFQLILTAADTGCGGAGDFDVEFRFTQCGWETGEASGGVGGFGGTEAQCGFDAGNGRDYVEVPGSRDAGISTIMCETSNVGETGIWRFQIRSGTVICPGAGEVCDTAMMGVCGEGRTRCVGATLECNSVVASSVETCDALDNDCDGVVDNEPPTGTLCPGASTCIEGTCVATCFEGACPPGLECDGTTDICVPEGCVGVVCADGERCSHGVCGDACAGIVCPHGLACQSGVCVNLCEGATCDDCTVCSPADGSCMDRCTAATCPAGTRCAADGTCIEAGCATTTCPTGTYCSGGECLDSCTDTVCPTGRECRAGACVMIQVDAGPPPVDAGTPDAAADDAGADAGSFDAGVDACRGFGCMTPPDEGRRSCACSAPGAGGSSEGGTSALFLALGLAWTVSRRRR